MTQGTLHEACWVRLQCQKQTVLSNRRITAQLRPTMAALELSMKLIGRASKVDSFEHQDITIPALPHNIHHISKTPAHTKEWHELTEQQRTN